MSSFIGILVLIVNSRKVIVEKLASLNNNVFRK